MPVAQVQVLVLKDLLQRLGPPPADLGQGKKRVFLFFLLFLTLGFINPKEEKRKVQKGEKGGKKENPFISSPGQDEEEGGGWMMLLLLYLLSACAGAESPKAKRDIFIFLKKAFLSFSRRSGQL